MPAAFSSAHSARRPRATTHRGPNHVLPTSGVARLRGGLSVADYLKVISVQRLSREALATLAPAIATLARAEGWKRTPAPSRCAFMSKARRRGARFSVLGRTSVRPAQAAGTRKCAPQS